MSMIYFHNMNKTYPYLSVCVCVCVCVCGTGWIIKIKCADPKQVESMMDEAAYKQYLASDH